MGGTPSNADREDEIYPQQGGNREGKIPYPEMPPTKGGDNLRKWKASIKKIGKLYDDPSIGAEKNRNYGIIPLHILHNIMLYLQVQTLLSMSLSCSLFWRAQNSKLFWKTYYDNYFKSKITNNNNNSNLKETNWKRKSVRRYIDSKHGDVYYRKKYEIVRFTDSVVDESVTDMTDGYFNLINKEEIEKLPLVTNFKLGIFGFLGSGKSSFVDRFLYNRFEEDMQSTIGARYCSVFLRYKASKIRRKYRTRNEQPPYVVVNLQIWDAGGQERYESLTPMYYRGALSVLIFFEMNSAVQFEKAKKLAIEIRKQGYRGVFIMLVGSKTEQIVHGEETLNFYATKIQPLLKKICKGESDDKNVNLADFVEVSSKENVNVYHTFGKILDFGIWKMIEEEESVEEIQWGVL